MTVEHLDQGHRAYVRAFGSAPVFGCASCGGRHTVWSCPAPELDATVAFAAMMEEE